MADFPGGPRFEVRQRLGAGTFGVVYEAYDRERQLLVALKTLRSDASDSLYLFKREFRALADLNHRNLVTLYELLTDGPRWFFTMELLRGRHFIDHAWDVVENAESTVAGHSNDASSAPTVMPTPVDLSSNQVYEHPGLVRGARPCNPLDYERVRETLIQLAEGLVALHEAGQLHRDIKPRNVMVTLEGRVVLLDFGLVASIGTDPTMGRIAGTPAYMSPEQATGRSLSAASDWYSVGVMLYETLTFHLPFGGLTADALIDRHSSGPPPVETWDPHVPSDLSRLCLDLLTREPASRPNGREVLRRLKRLARAEPRRALTVAAASPFVGRQQELTSLDAAYDAMTKGRAVVTYVRGVSGIGKTTVVQQFLRQLGTKAPETVVLKGRCYQQESVPYKGLDLLVDELSQRFRTMPNAVVEALLPRDVAALMRLFPILKRVDAIALARRRSFDLPDLPDAQEARRRAVGAFRELLARLAERWPLVVFIDDLQWSDLDSTSVLAEVLRPPDPPKLMFLGTYRSDEASTSPALRQLLAVTRDLGIGVHTSELALREFGLTEVGELVAALADGDASSLMALTRQVHRESGGNPFFVQELTRRSGRHGAPETTGDVDLEFAILRRISAIAGDTTRLLQVLALAGRPLVPRIALTVAGGLPHDYSVLASLRGAQLIRSRQTDLAEEIELYHDRIRDVVNRSISAADAVTLHERLALVLEASGNADPEMLALHFAQAGHSDRAAGHAVVAADRAAALLAFDRASRLYQLALSLQQDPTKAAGLRVKLGDALANAGRGGDAGQAYLAAAADVANDRALFVELQRRAAEQFLISGHMDRGMAALNSVLHAVGMRLARTPFSAMLLLPLRRLVIRLRGLQFRERSSAELPPDLLLRIDSCWSVAIGLAFVDSIRAAEFQARHCLLALRSGEPNRIARALALEAGYLSLGGTGAHRRTATVVRLASSLAERLGKPHTLGLAWLTAGIAAHLEGRWRTSLDLCERAETLLRDSCTGVTWELDTARLHIVNNIFLLGELRTLCDRAPALIASADDRGDLYGATALVLRTAFVTALVRDDPDAAVRDLARAESAWSERREFLLQHYWSTLARLDVFAYQGNGPAAYELIDRRWRKFIAAQMRRVQFTRVESSYRRARSALMCALNPSSPSSQRRRLLREVAHHCRVLVNEPMDWSIGLGHLVRAGAVLSRGEDGALTALTLAEERFERAGMALHAVLSRRARGRLIGGEQGRALLDASDAWLHTQGVVSCERFSRMIAGWV